MFICQRLQSKSQTKMVLKEIEIEQNLAVLRIHIKYTFYHYHENST